MAHGKLRTAKNCLNCNAEVKGRFCSVCGQENIEPTETFWNLVSHFLYDLFHYDGKVLSTLKALIFKPGLLTHEYVRGRRTSYLHPIRLYIFISAVFFIIFISFIVGKNDLPEINTTELPAVQRKAIEKTIDRLKDSLAVTSDTDERQSIQNEINTLKQVPGIFKDSQKNNDTAIKEPRSSDTSNYSIFDEKLPNSLKEYQTLQVKLSPDKKDGFFKHAINYKTLELKEKFQDDSKGTLESLKEHFLHLLPTMMFISLPVAALIFSLLYIRHKKFTYVQHGVFTVHIYSAVFVFILMLYALDVLNNYLHWQLISILKTIGVLFIFYYLYKAMRNFYEQRRWKTIFKYFILFICYSFVLSLLTIIFFLTSLIQV